MSRYEFLRLCTARLKKLNVNRKFSFIKRIMQLRKLKQQIEKQVIDIFPSIPKINITAYIHHHPSLSAVDFIVHFLEIAEPTKKTLNLNSDLLIAQARQILQHKQEEQEKQNNRFTSRLSVKEKEELAEIQKIVITFDIKESNKKFAGRLSQAITRIRMQKKRSKFQNEDYFERLAFEYAYELKCGYKSIDSNDWKKWFESHPDYATLKDINFCCGFVPHNGDSIHSIISMMQCEEDKKQIIFSSVRFCGVGVSISKDNSVFFSLFVANRDIEY